jgi:sugar/nucleoside kinase (ribokinase family)
MSSVDLFLPSRQDGRVIVPDASAADTVRRLRTLSPDTPLIALKCGADGCVAHAKDSPDLLIIPAVPVEAHDTTGAGDTFCGGALVGYARTRDPVQALLHGAVSASFCVSTVGVEGLLKADASEAERRRVVLTNSVRAQAF